MSLKYRFPDCPACRGEAPRLSADEIAQRLGGLEGEWRVVQAHHLERDYALPDFREAVALANRIADVAEAEGHHPELCVSWGRLRVVIWTYKVDGLTEADFALAAKVEHAFAPIRQTAAGINAHESLGAE